MADDTVLGSKDGVSGVSLYICFLSDRRKLNSYIRADAPIKNSIVQYSIV